MVFDYSLEDTDMLSATAGVYNGYQTVMWNNVRDAFPSELRSLYQTIRAQGIISYDNVEQRFESHQNVWPEAIFNEDAYFKYVKPFIEQGENNLYMCLGSKAEQRKWWLYNRFRYIDSKYNAGYSSASYLQARVYQKSDLEITPYADIYASAMYDSNLVSAKAPRGQATIVASPESWNPGGADAVLRIFSADQIKSLGDLSGFYVGAVSFAAATKLQDIKLGDSSSNYSNEQLTEVTFGTNTLLRTVDIRNCPNLTQVVEFDGCTNLEEVHLEGTSVAGATFANGGSLVNLYLPNTITSLILRNLTKLQTVDLGGTSNLTTLWMENIDDSIVDGLEILRVSMADTGRAVRLVGFDKDYQQADLDDLWVKIQGSLGLNDTGDSTTPYAYLDGEITVDTLSRNIYDSLSNYPFLHISYTTLGEYMYQKYVLRGNNFTTYSDNTITTIRPSAFYDSKLTNINCPNVTEIGDNAFYHTVSNGTNITYMNIGSPTKIGKYAFQRLLLSASGNIDLSEVTWIDGQTFDTASVDHGISEIRLPSLQTLYISGGAEGAFKFCYSASLIDLPNGVSYTGSKYFSNNQYFFTNCNNLTALILRSTTMLSFLDHANVLQYTPIRQAGNYSTVGQGYVYVPRSLVDAYKADWAGKTNFTALQNYIRAIEDYPAICDPS